MSTFSTFIRRRCLPGLMAAAMVAAGMGSALAPIQAMARGGPGQQRTAAHKHQRGEMAQDLRDELRSPHAKKARWSRNVGGVHMVQLLISSDAADDQMQALRTEVRRQGGKVQVVHSSMRLLTVLMPAVRVAALSQHSDVKSITPNRDTQSTGSALESIVGAMTAGVRIYSKTTKYSGYDGTGVGIAILDSGVMKAHKNFLDAAGATRVKRSVNMLNAAGADWANPWDGPASLQPGSTALNNYETAIAADSALTQDPYGHGTHVASVAAGRGFYQSPDATGVAPNANVYDVRVLNNLGIGTISDAIEGINWVMYHAREYNIRVLNISLAAQSTDTYGADPLCHAVRMATAMGITVVAAGGNFGLTLAGKEVYGAVSSPGNEPSAITVGAVNTLTTTARSDDTVNLFSSRGPTRGVWVDPATSIGYPDNVLKPDLVAPGNKVLGASATQASTSTPTKNTLATLFPLLETAVPTPTTYAQRLMYLSGTSIATPVVAGAAAVLLQANPGLTPPLVKAILQLSLIHISEPTRPY